MLLRIKAPYYVAGVIVNSKGKIVRTAPILGRFKGKHVRELYWYCTRNKFKVQNLGD